MFTYSPKLHHAIFTALIGIGFMLLSAKAQGRTLQALNIGAFGFALLTVLVMWMLIVQSINDQTREQTEWMIAYSKLDDEGRAEMANHFPTMRYRKRRGIVRPYWEDTNVPIGMFQTFLKTSNKQYISPERDWNSTDMPRKVWQEIKDNLEAEGKVEPDSAAGSHSWKWIGNSYQHYCADYWMAGRELTYASETERVDLT